MSAHNDVLLRFYSTLTIIIGSENGNLNQNIALTGSLVQTSYFYLIKLPENVTSRTFSLLTPKRALSAKPSPPTHRYFDA